MDMVFFSLPGNEQLTKSLALKCNSTVGEFEFRHFPDREMYVRIKTSVKNKVAILVCSLNSPGDKLLLLYYISKTVKDLGARHVCLVAPYLAYMRQDIRFKEGEAVTSSYFAKLISFFVDSLITIDPHLHRRNNLSEIYTIPTNIIHSMNLLSQWIRKHVQNPLLIGPDEESIQWVSEVAKIADVPYLVLTKKRTGDQSVEILMQNDIEFKEYTPVLIDDIISTGETMLTTIGALKGKSFKQPVCIGVHGIFANDSYKKLIESGAQAVVTTNSIVHESNQILIDDLLSDEIHRFFKD